ncbi:hypothetical protein TTHERM_00503830 (macronuclear) [Tetrahymena thermophila SB210]|uniref:Uncharacterized protein n=1 Tax=Tetrahymena thermophila (strain SB210) TaxID=312017 RepID=I7LUM0_TETTS|nr:hypothetical protein TTHERM_00503830 [Tetrahymena thermophila SB210]EAR94937.2 hypothetical protein TTHERM_00503830 [Tetrahymena thermophila SB210]|eukprot:XP_001015182.2 hypothetical protein TTHERM_00503830 [Tetrahymena thermophila SB210]
MSERLNQSKIILNTSNKFNNKNNNNDNQRRLFYSPQSRKLPKINLTDSQLNKQNKMVGVVGKQVYDFSNGSRKIRSVERQEQSLQKKEHSVQQIQYLKQETKSYFQDDNNSIEDQVSIIQQLQIQDQITNENDQSNKSNHKAITKIQGQECQQLTSLLDIPNKITKNQAMFSPKRLPNKHIQYTQNNLTERKNQSQKEGILQTYRYDKDLINLYDDFANSHVVKIKNRLQNDLNTTMIIKYKQLQKLYDNQMKYFQKLSQNANNNSESDQFEDINLQKLGNQGQYGEYQVILDQLQFLNINQNENLELAIHDFETTVFIQLLESLVEGCSLAIKEQLLFLQNIFNRIIYVNTSSKIVNQLQSTLKKQQCLNKQTTYAQGLFFLLDYLEKKQTSKADQEQANADDKLKIEEKFKTMKRRIEELESTVFDFEQKEKQKEEHFQKKQMILLNMIEQKDKFLENDVKKEMQVLQMQIDISENEHKLAIQQYQNMLKQKTQEIQEQKDLNDAQQKKFSQLEQEYHLVLQNQAQSIKWMIKNSENADKLHQKLNQYKDMLQTITQQHKQNLQDLTPRPSFKKIDSLIESNKFLLNNNKPSKKLFENKIHEIISQGISNNNSNSNIQQDQQYSENKIKENNQVDKISTSSKLDEINEFISQILQKLKKQKQPDVYQNRNPRPSKLQK